MRPGKHRCLSLPSCTIIDEQGGDSNGGELAELTSTEISLDLQGLIDDANFNDDNLFGDLGDAKRNELNNVGSVYQQGGRYSVEIIEIPYTEKIEYRPPHL